MSIKGDTKTAEEPSEKIQPKGTKVRGIQILKLPVQQKKIQGGGDWPLKGGGGGPLQYGVPPSLNGKPCNREGRELNRKKRIHINRTQQNL